MLLWTYKPLQNCLFTIKLQITKNRKTQYITTPFSASIQQWDKKSGRVYKTHPQFQEVNDYIETMLIETQNMYKVSKAVNPVIEIKRKQAAIFDVPSYLSYLKNHMDRLEKKGKFGTRKKYNTIFQHLQKHLGDNVDLFFNEITEIFLEDFVIYLQERKVKHIKKINNGIRTYLKGFKMLYNKAINEDLFIPEKNPFKNFSLPEMEEVEQRHLNLDQLKRLIETDISFENTLFHYKNYFLFQTFAQGMRVSDINLLRWSDFTEGSIKYQMLKTKMKVEVPYSKNMLKVLRFYTGSDYSEFELNSKSYRNGVIILDPAASIAWDIIKQEFYVKILKDIQSLANDPQTRDKFVFPILGQFEFPAGQKTFSRKQYALMESRNAIYNKQLKALAKKAELGNIRLSTHYCRHTFTHLLIVLGADIYDISKCLGHSNLSTTQVYADKFNLPRIQRVSEKVDDLIKI